MEKDKKPQQDKFSVITLSEYLEKTGAITQGLKVKEALRLIYNDNNVIQEVEYKGEHYFVIKN